MNGVTWAKAHNCGRCAECSERIRVGDRIAHWLEVCLINAGTRIRLRRRYCEPCGKLLEDSLTTTEVA